MSLKLIFAVVTVCLAMGAAGLALLVKLSPSVRKDIASAVSRSIEKTSDLLSESDKIKIDARSWQARRFNVEPGRALISGHVLATGGSGNDIEVLILRESQFANFAQGSAGEAIFRSAKTHRTDLYIPMTEGSYYIVFDNRFSLLSSKLVSGSVKLRVSP